MAPAVNEGVHHQDSTRAEVYAGVIERLLSRRKEIERAIHSAIRHDVPGPVGRNSDYEAGTQAALIALLDFSLDAIARGPQWHPSPHPPEVIAQARRAARNGVSLGVVMRRCVAGHIALAAFIDEEVEALNPRETSLFRHLRKTQEALLTYLTASIEYEYNDEVAGIGLVKRLLAGESVDPRELSYTIDDKWHIGIVVAAGTQGEETLQSLGRHFDCAVWSVLSSEATLWAWLGRSEALASADLQRIVNCQPSTGLRFAAGEPGRGLSGWRVTHQQAKEAFEVAHLYGRSLTRFADVALVALLKDNAESLIDIYLSPLNAHREPEVLRETLQKYFAAGHNASSAASALRIDRRTVHNRVQWVEKAFGQRLHAISAELEIALRLEGLRANNRI